jgi:hypothetical protein
MRSNAGGKKSAGRRCFSKPRRRVASRSKCPLIGESDIRVWVNSENRSALTCYRLLGRLAATKSPNARSSMRASCEPHAHVRDTLMLSLDDASVNVKSVKYRTIQSVTKCITTSRFFPFTRSCGENCAVEQRSRSSNDLGRGGFVHASGAPLVRTFRPRRGESSPPSSRRARPGR